jgi:hypothetical protein
VLSIPVNEELAKQAEQLVFIPEALVKVLEAANRMIVASQKAGTLMYEHDRKETEKDAPREESQTLKALREFRKSAIENSRLKEKGVYLEFPSPMTCANPFWVDRLPGTANSNGVSGSKVFVKSQSDRLRLFATTLFATAAIFR